MHNEWSLFECGTVELWKILARWKSLLNEGDRYPLQGENDKRKCTYRPREANLFEQPGQHNRKDDTA